MAVHLPVRAPGEGTAVVEVARRHGDYAVVGVVVQVRVEAGAVVAARAVDVSAGELGEVHDLVEPVRGAPVDEAPWDRCGDLAAEVVAVEPDIHATAAYRSELVRGLTVRALRAAAADATGEGSR